MIGLRLINRAEAVFPATPASEGRQVGLPFIPGAALWGALAARIYAHPAHRARAFDLVHGGRLRLSPGFPATGDDQPAFPWPQCLQHPKHEHGSRLWNTLDGPLEQAGERVQTEPPKAGQFIDATRRFTRPGRRERGKAAISHGDRRAEDAQFFQYELLDAGTTWLAWIDADDPADLAIATELLDGATLQLGRSKRREFGGAVAVAVLPGWAPSLPCAPRPGEHVLWCLSDLALPDRCGGIDLAPEPERFGIAGFTGRLDRSRSLITTRRYAPYNLYLRARDREHAVIEAGSVLVYTGGALAGPALRSLGLWRERGLGLVWADPAPLASTGAAVKAEIAAQPPPAAPSAALSDAEQALAAVLRARAGRARASGQASTAAEALFAQLWRRHCDEAEADRKAPSVSQWSRVAEAAASAADLAGLRAVLFTSPNAICAGAANEEWGRIGEDLKTMIDRPGPIGAEAWPLALERAARKMAAQLRKAANR